MREVFGEGAMAAILAIDQGEFTEIVADTLRRAFGRERDGVKMLARAANANHRTAENWLNGRSTPDALHFLRLVATVPELQAEVRRLAAMEADIDPELQRDITRTIATFQRLQSIRSEP